MFHLPCNIKFCFADDAIHERSVKKIAILFIFLRNPQIKTAPANSLSFITVFTNWKHFEKFAFSKKRFLKSFLWQMSCRKRTANFFSINFIQKKTFLLFFVSKNGQETYNQKNIFFIFFVFFFQKLVFCGPRCPDKTTVAPRRIIIILISHTRFPNSNKFLFKLRSNFGKCPNFRFVSIMHNLMIPPT